MDFTFTSDQELLQSTVASFVRKESPVSRVRATRKDPVGWSRDLWKRMGDLGWLALPFAESAGGLGGTMIDAALLLEQLGTTLVPEPYLSSAILAGTALAEAANEAQRERFLAPLLAGDTVVALAWAEVDGRYDPASIGVRAEKTGGGWKLTGTKRFVLEGHAADLLVVSARTAGANGDRDGVSLFAVDAGAPGVAKQPVGLIDGHRAAIVELAGVEVGADRLLGHEGAGLAALELALDRAAAGACAEAVGLMQTVLHMTCDYLRTREQFGVKIGTFQALQHRAVDMFIETELSRSAMYMAAIRAGDPDAVQRASSISVAKAQIAQSGRFVTQQSIQLHGGIGISDEHDIGLYFKRMQALGSLFGDEDHHVTRFASLPSFVAAAG
jgi:alkylation response protein AidB-like acyl-CoA dehydrogenase